MAVKEKVQNTQLEVTEEGLAVLTIDTEGKLNVLSPPVFEELDHRFRELADKPEVKALLILSGKPGSFIAGADVKFLNTITQPEEGAELSRQGQSVFNRLEQLPFPKLCAIDGVCLGGGLELALATDYRLVSEDNSTQMGLPEVQLGLIPGAGGTQRLPRLVGLTEALGMILTGKKVRPRKARKIHLADEVVPIEILEERARKAAMELAQKSGMAWDILEGRTKTLGARVAESFGVRSAIYSKAKADLRDQTGGKYPAPFKALEAIRIALKSKLEDGLEVEAKLFGEAAASTESKSLIHLFNSTTALKADSGVDDKKVKARELKRPAIIGGGLMGSGIATVLADVGYNVRVKDISKDTLGGTKKYAFKVFDKKVKRKHIRGFDRDLKLSRISPTVDYSGFKKTDVVIEAVFEDLGLKHKMVKDIEENCNEDTIFASNTSSLPIADIAKGAKRPENVIGMHFFSPVEKMQLVEVIVTPQTSPEVTASVVELSKKMKKHTIVVGDGAGFYTSRVVGAFCSEAVRVLYDGGAIEDIDKAVKGSGFPVGPMILIDEVGLDVVSKVMKIMMKAFPGRFEAPDGWEELIEGRKGRKSGLGFYRYAGKKKEPDSSIYKGLPEPARKRMEYSEIADRCMFAFMNECAMIYEEKILRHPRDGDIGAVFGLGFPPFLGGPFFHMDRLGAAQVVKRLKELQGRYGDHFKPAAILEKMAGKGETFY